MSGSSKIEWTEHVWNPIRGCSRVSEGCRHCYAERIAARFSGLGKPYEGLAWRVAGEPRWTGFMQFAEKVLTVPSKRRKSTRYFVNSMSDLYHEGVPTYWLDRIYEVMARCPQHQFLILTKRPERMRAYCRQFAAPWPNVWLGVSIEDQKTADERLPLLLETPAAVRFISAEPLLGPVDLHMDAAPFPGTSLDWVIVGGESGPGARPMHPDWVRSIRNQCQAAGVPFFFKQRGQWTWVEEADYDNDRFPNHPDDWRERDRGVVCMRPDGVQVSGYGGRGEEFLYRVGKKTAGRELDGRTHDDSPHSPAE